MCIRDRAKAIAEMRLYQLSQQDANARRDELEVLKKLSLTYKMC